MDYPYSLFVTVTGDVYIANGWKKNTVDKWTLNGTNEIPVMNCDRTCASLFVDISNNLYCSIMDHHQVVMKSLNETNTAYAVIAGNDRKKNGKSEYSLHHPIGIFVDINFDLYVADSRNNRIQLFTKGSKQGKTKIGQYFKLNKPTGVVLDGDGYLFIVDQFNKRIIRANSTNFQCIIGCYQRYLKKGQQRSGGKPDKSYNPITMRFDSHGNIFVVEMLGNNARIKKFDLIGNSSKTYYYNIKVSLIHSDQTTSQCSTCLVESTTATTTGLKLNPFNFYRHSFSDVSKPRNLTSICDTKPCRNNGTCLLTNTTSYQYSCNCSAGYRGVNCEIDVRPCKPYTCSKNGFLFSAQ